MFYISDTDLAFRATLDGSGFASGAQSINGHLHQMGIATNSATASLGPLGTILGSMASPLSLVALGATAVGGALMGSVQAAAAWETSMSGVAKTTGMAGPALAELSGELLEMSTNIPIAASELASIAQAGGSLGIAKEELAGFTEVAAQMGVGFEMSAAQAATAGAKILTAFQTDVSAENLRNLGNVVNKMGDDFPATEAQVLDFTNRASYLNTTFGLGVPAVAAWGTALISVGMESETAATGIKSLMNMSMDPKKFEEFAKVAGMSGEELRESLNEDVAGTYEMIAEKIAGGTDAVTKFQTVSKLAGTEGMTTLLKMGGAAYAGEAALKKANAEWENGTSLAKTFAAQSETVNAQWTMFTNTVGVAATELGTVLLPVVSDTLELMTGLTKSAIEAGEAIGGWYHDFQNTTLKESDQAILDFFGISTSTEAENLISAQEMATQTADVYGDYLEAGIAGNEELQTVTGDTLGSDASLSATKEAGKANAKAFADAQEAYIKSHSSGGYSLATMLMMAGQSGSGTSGDNIWNRQFEYLGKQFELQMRFTSQGIWSDFWKIGDATAITTGMVQTSYDPLKAFELATGLPAPEAGTAAYYRLMGNALKAEQIELQAELDANKIDLNLDLKTSLETLKSWDPVLVGKIRGMLKSIETEVRENPNTAFRDYAINAAKEFDEALATMSLQGLAELPEKAEAMINAASPGLRQVYQKTADDSIVAYKDSLLSGIADTGGFVKTEMERIGGDAKDAFEDGFISSEGEGNERDMLLGLGPQLNLLRELAPEQFEKMGGEAILAMIEAVKAGDLPGAFALVGKMSGEEFKKNLVGGMAIELPSLLKLVEDPAKIKGTFDDINKWQQGHFIPQMNNNVDEIKKLMESGVNEDKIYDAYVKPLDAITEYMPQWLNRLGDMYEQGQISLADYVSLYEQMTSTAKEASTEKADSMAKSAGMFYGELIDDTKKWQDFMNAEGGYVGPTAYYDDYRQATDPNKLASQQINEKYGITTIGTISLEMETMKADETKTAFEEAIKASNPEMAMSIETQAAMDEVNRLVSYIITVNPVMSVQVQVSAYAGEIRAIVESEVRAALA